jgi:colicin import membrane protein
VTARRHNDKTDVVSAVFAVLLHGLILAVMIFAVDFSRPQRPATPLAIEATLVTDAAISVAPPVREPEPEPEIVQEPEPEPDPPPPQPDPAEQARVEAEARKRQQELEAEQARIRQQQETERERLQQQAEERRRREEAERERQRQEALEREQREEAEKERLRQETERKRLEDIERQRLENERKRQEAEDAERRRRLAQELAEEEQRDAAMASGELAAYRFAIEQKIQRNWVKPASAGPGLECVLLVRQLPGGTVSGVTIERCNGDDAVRRSIEAAVHKASPLPEPDNPMLFDRNLRITFKPEQ